MKHIYIIHPGGRSGMYGIGTYLRSLVLSLKGENIKVTVVEIFSQNKEIEVKCENNIRYLFVPAPGHFKFLWKGPALIRQNERIYQGLALLLGNYVNSGEENIFHLNSTDCDLLAARLKEYYNGRIVLTVHYTGWSLDTNGDKRKFRRILRRTETNAAAENEVIIQCYEIEKNLIGQYADRVIAVSGFVYRDLLETYGVKKNKLVLISNALKDAYISDKNRRRVLRAHLAIEENEVIIVYAGRLDEGKGARLLIRAFKSVVSRFPDARLVMAGDGDIAEAVREASPVWSRITFTGLLTRKELYRLYSIGDIGVVPSAYEAFGYVAAEMMMHSLPVIATDTTGLSEIVEEGITGFKIIQTTGSGAGKKKMVSELTAKINILIQDSALRCKLGRAGRKKFKACYDLPVFKSEMLSLYHSLEKNSE